MRRRGDVPVSSIAVRTAGLRRASRPRVQRAVDKWPAPFLRAFREVCYYCGLFIVFFNICESLTLLLRSFVSAQLLYFSIQNKDC